MFTIGIDPHKGSHVAAVLDEHEMLLEGVALGQDACDVRTMMLHGDRALRINGGGVNRGRVLRVSVVDDGAPRRTPTHLR